MRLLLKYTAENSVILMGVFLSNYISLGVDPRSEPAVTDPLKSTNTKRTSLSQSQSLKPSPSDGAPRHSSGGDPRFQILFPVWTNPLLYSVYSERRCCLRRSTESRDLRSSPSTGCHGHRQGCITPETCPHKPEAELRKVDADAT